MGPGNDFRLRIYGFTDLPPSLTPHPLPAPADRPRAIEPRIKYTAGSGLGSYIIITTEDTQKWPQSGHLWALGTQQ